MDFVFRGFLLNFQVSNDEVAPLLNLESHHEDVWVSGGTAPHILYFET